MHNREVATSESNERHFNTTALEARLENIYTKYGIDRNEHLDYQDPKNMVAAAQIDSRAWIQARLLSVEELLKEANRGDAEALEKLHEAIDYWEHYKQTH